MKPKKSFSSKPQPKKSGAVHSKNANLRTPGSGNAKARSAKPPWPEKSNKDDKRPAGNSVSSKFAKSEFTRAERSEKPKWGAKASKTSKGGTFRSSFRDKTDDRQERPARTGRPARRGRVSFYSPKTFKGAQSKDEEAQLSEGTVQRIALEILNQFEETQDRADHLLQQSIHKNAKLLGAREKGNLTKTVLNIVRWKLRIDYIVSKSLKMDSESLETTLKSAYRLAAFNVVWMNKSAEKCISLSDFAIPKEFGKYKETVRHFIKFLNKAKNDIPYPNPKKNLVNAISVTYSHPVWLVEKWLGIYSEQDVVKLCEFNNAEPPLTVRVNPIKASVKEAIGGIEREGFQAAACQYAEYGLNVTGRGEIFVTEGFKNGAFDIQDESSQLFAAWCDPQPNHTVIDACAGSGGKSLYFSASMNNKGKIIASDPNQRSLEKLSKRAARAGSGNIEIVDLQNKEVADLWKDKADKVVIDAPCSGLGTLARNPDIKWRFDPETFPQIVAEQISILNYFASFVKKGGELIYGTCTLNPDENEHVIRHFLATDSRFEIRLDHPKKFVKFIDDKGFFYIQPFKQGLSGFFGCKMIRK